MKTTEWPQRGDLVVVKVKRIMPYGAVAELVEYTGKEAFIHVSQVSTSWVKNIRSFVSEGQMRVGEVKKVDREKRTVDVSFRHISPKQEKRKMNEWKREKRADHLFERMCKDLKEEFSTAYVKVAVPLADEFGDLLSTFENVKVNGKEVLNEVEIPEKWKDAIIKYAESIALPEVTIRGELSLSIDAGDGVKAIREALKQAEGEGVKLEYISAPKYRVEVTAPDYQEAEQVLKSAAENAVAYLKKKGGEASFERIKA